MEIPEGFVDISHEQDKGVLKKIIKEGEGEIKPNKGATVYVHYTGTLFGGEKNGEKFDSSRDRGDKFSFVLGEGQVIKAWDIGIASMKKGELAELICAPAYAYGQQDNGSIPANSTLKFEVELFEWKGKDISPDKDGSLSQTIIKEGSGFDTPKDCSLVKLSYKILHNGNNVEEKDCEFEIGDADSYNIIGAIELAAVKMKKGETSLFDVDSKHAYGTKGKTELGIPPNANIQCEITMKEFDKVKDSYNLDTSAEKLEYCEKFKLKATEKLKANKIKYAIKLYNKAMGYIDYDGDFSDEDKVAAGKLKLSLHLNLALCYIKIEDDSGTIEECEKALEIEKNNEKALYRYGQGLMMRGEYNDAKVTFQKVLEVNSSNNEALKQIKICDGFIRENVKREKELYKSMFANINKVKTSGDKKNGDVDSAEVKPVS